MQIQKFEFNPFPVNTYLIWDEKSREAILLDPGCYYPEEREALQRFVEERELAVKHLLATHLHLDHVFGAPFAVRTFGTLLTAHPADAFLLDRMAAQAAAFGMELPEPPVPVGREIREGNRFRIGDETFEALHVPGHSPGSIVFYNEASKVAFAGDVLFRGSIGRSDLPGGNYETLVDGICRKLLPLPDDVTVCSGHGPETTIGFERKNNPYLS